MGRQYVLLRRSCRVPHDAAVVDKISICKMFKILLVKSDYKVSNDIKYSAVMKMQLPQAA